MQMKGFKEDSVYKRQLAVKDPVYREVEKEVRGHDGYAP
jgi:hypothetical protein